MKELQNTTIGLVLPSVPGYSETFFRSKIEGLQNNGAKVIVFSTNPIKIIEQLPFKVVYAPKFNGTKVVVFLSIAFELLKAVTFNYKVTLKYLGIEKREGSSFKQRIKSLIANNFILSQNLDWLHFGFGTMALGKENVPLAIGAKMGVSFRGFDIGIYPLKHPNCYEKLFKKVDKIHVISKDLAELVFKQGLGKIDIVTKIRPAINTLFFKKIVHDESSIVNLLTIGRLHWKKGLEYTLEALAILKNEGIPFHYTVIGEGPERERLIFAAYQLGIQKDITFAGRLNPSEVKEKLNQSKVYIQYSIQEGFCNSVLEAQAMGLLCIVSDAEGLSENILDKETGWVVPKRKPLLLAAQIKDVIALPSLQKEIIVERAVKRVKEEFNIEKQIKEFVNFYK